MGERKDLGGVGKRYRTFAWRIEGGEEENEEGDETKMGPILFWYDEAETGCEQCPCHVGEGKEKKCTATPSIDGPDGGPRENEVHETETEGGEQCLQPASTSVDEDGRRVECNNVDTAHLLSQHHSERGAGGTSDTGNSEQFDEAGNVVALANDVGLLLDLGLNVVEITSSLERGVSKLAE